MKVIKGTGGYVNLWALNQKISGLTFVNPNIPSLKYGRDMEPEAINTFTDVMKKTHKNFAVQERGLILLDNHPFIWASPDAIASCSCCQNFCVEVKCPHSISHTSPKDAELAFIEKEKDQFKLKRHIYIILSVSYKWQSQI